jgi:hypothetical protein
MKKVKVSETKGIVLDWMVAECMGVLDETPPRVVIDSGCICDKTVLRFNPMPQVYYDYEYSPSTKWEHSGHIIDENNISIIRCDDTYGVDSKGFCNNKHIPVWVATSGQHSAHEQYGSCGDYYGEGYVISTDSVCYGETALIAAMRKYVTDTLGETVKVPDELF